MYLTVRNLKKYGYLMVYGGDTGIKFYISHPSKEHPGFLVNAIREVQDDDVFLSLVIYTDSGAMERGNTVLAQDIVEYVNKFVAPENLALDYKLYTEDQFFEYFGSWLPF